MVWSETLQASLRRRAGDPSHWCLRHQWLGSPARLRNDAARSRPHHAAMNGLSRRAELVLASGMPVAISIPVLAASPSPSGAPPRCRSPKSGEARQRSGDRHLKGTVQTAVDPAGIPTYTLTANGKIESPSAGPRTRFSGRQEPAWRLRWKSVTVAGTTKAGDTNVDVESSMARPFASPGKPPWAGGRGCSARRTRGWKPWMADGEPGRGSRQQESAPGQLKKETAAP